MAKKKPSASSRPAKLMSVSAESIFSKPLGKKQKAVLSRIAKRQAAGDDSGIDYSDIPPLTDEQLAQFRRTPKVLVAARIDREVYDWLLQYGKGYSTRINSILRTVMDRTRYAALSQLSPSEIPAAGPAFRSSMRYGPPRWRNDGRGRARSIRR
jgi:uncharacterized protein (DUF4415 family)